MAFLRRKSGVYHDDIYQEDLEPQRRRRLSKPQTNSSYTNLSSLSIHQMTRQKSRSKASLKDSSPVMPMLPNESRDVLRSYLFTSASEADLARPKSKRSSVALMTARFEKNNSQASTSQLSLASPTLPKRPVSLTPSSKRALDSHKTSVSSKSSKDRYGALDLGNVSPASSTEDLNADPAPRARRTASFTPGMATRAVSVPREAIAEETEPAVDEVEAVTVQDVVRNLLRTNADESSDSTPQYNRSGTPTGLGYPNIGGLGPGSLRVVNGASSPAPSDFSRLSRPLFGAIERRDSASTYAESEIETTKSRKGVKGVWEDKPPLRLTGDDASKSMPGVYRAFSFKPGGESTFNDSERRPSNPTAHTEQSNIIEEEDQTKMLAEDYMADLPMSPYEAATPPVSTQALDTKAQLPLGTVTPSLVSDVQQDSQAESLSTTSHDVLKTPTSESSVRRHTDKTHSRRSFFDEAIGSSPTLDQSDSATSLQASERPESPASFFSVPETDNSLEEQFKSAVELQPTRTRSMSPRKRLQKSPLKEALTRNATALGSTNTNTKSDSGYSSNTSSSTMLPPTEEIAEKQESRGLMLAFRKSFHKSRKPLLVEPTASTKAPSPTSAAIESVSALTSTSSFGAPPETNGTESVVASSILLPKEKEKQRKKLQKQRRKSTADVAGGLVMQRLVSTECLNVPEVPSVARTNLAQRSKAVPELERTFKTQDHTTDGVNTSRLSLVPVLQDLRFPSPEPEEEQREGRSKSKSRTRKRSISRPRSWFGRSTDEKDEPKKKPLANEPSRLSISDLGSVADLLGANPYDMARNKPCEANPVSRSNRPRSFHRGTSPSNITTKPLRPKSTMDDVEASNFSKARRSASVERNTQPTSHRSFDDRGGIPGKLPHQARVSMDDAPPLPPMPSPDEINRRYSYRHGYAIHPSPLAYASPRFPEPTPIDEPEEAPPPPPHSPRPSYIDDDKTNEPGNPTDEVLVSSQYSPRPSADGNIEQPEHAIDDEPPPLPCHSPQPMDVTHQRRTREPRYPSWSSQASAWRARRLSASGTLRESMDEAGQDRGSVQQQPLRHVAPSHSVRRKPVPRQSYDQPPDQWRNGLYPEQGYSSHAWHSNQPVYTGNRFYAKSSPDREQYIQSQNAQAKSDQHTTYADTPWQSTSHDDRLQQQQPSMSGDYFAWRPPFDPNNISQNSQASPVLDQQRRTHDPPRPRLHTRSKTYDGSSRPTSRHSLVSRPTSRDARRKSLAEELHPEINDVPPLPSNLSRSQSPHIGRYSGGLEYNFDRNSRGFDGSAGTRSTSTAMENDSKKDKTKRGGWLDMEAYGVDFGDIPAMSVPVGATGSRMAYH
ncbi:hypothetical protein OHC33_007392 [Knufia fluminis]|uniref:Proteophosphoglycan ppg4 n=1 Tax=Knufia fluminis TaxID=191047 RepID=A0AAN8EHL3_9EURO|nr:hypothetical protein OHC33_007392 [Knufia fluminis]